MDDENRDVTSLDDFVTSGKATPNELLDKTSARVDRDKPALDAVGVVREGRARESVHLSLTKSRFGAGHICRKTLVQKRRRCVVLERGASRGGSACLSGRT